MQRSHKALSFAQKKELCCHKTANPTLTQAALALWAQEKFALEKPLSQSTVSAILSKRPEYNAMTTRELAGKRQRKIQSPEIEEALMHWISQCTDNNIMLTYDLIREKAKSFSEMMNLDSLCFSNGWMEKFLLRNGLKAIKCHGESGSVDVQAMEATLPSIIDKIASYSSSHVYNMDETGLFYRLAPDKTIAQRQVSGVKKDKSRITIALTTNADGSDKLQPLFIGHSRMPRSFKKRTAIELGFCYSYNKRAWMTTLIFQDWLLEVENEMRKKKKKILLLLDNAPSHKCNLELEWIEILYLPPNCTSVIQPLDAGIIAAFKRRYRRFQLRDAIDKMEKCVVSDIYKVDQLTAMRWCVAAWNEVTKDTVQNCFMHTGLFGTPRLSSLSSPEEESRVEADLQRCMTELQVENEMTVFEFVMPNCETSGTQKELTDEDIMTLVMTAEQDEEQSEENNEEDSQIFSHTDHLKAIPIVLSILNISDPKELEVYNLLRRKQDELKSKRMIQSKLDGWITNKTN